VSWYTTKIAVEWHIENLGLCTVAGGFKSFSASCPHLVRSDLWNSRDVGNGRLGEKLNHCRQLRSDTFRCHPAADEVLTHHNDYRLRLSTHLSCFNLFIGAAASASGHVFAWNQRLY